MTMKKTGFTLIELLVVIVVISILATLVVGGANYTIRVSRERRRDISCKALQTAIYRYRAEYNEWPGGVQTSSNAGRTHTFLGDDNKKVFGMLRAANDDDNPDHIHFLDETAFFAPAADGGAVKLSEWPKPERPDTQKAAPLVFAARSGRWTDKSGNYLYYRVTIDFDDETVTVDTKNNKNVDLFYDEDEEEETD